MNVQLFECIFRSELQDHCVAKLLNNRFVQFNVAIPDLFVFFELFTFLFDSTPSV